MYLKTKDWKKMNIPAFVTVRTTSSRLPKKCLLPFGEGNVLEHVIRRAKHFGLDPIVCTTVEGADDIVETIARAERVECFRGSVKHKLKRWLGCCNAFGIEAFHTVDADDPFFDAALVIKSFQLLKTGYDVVYPTDSSKEGGGSVGFSLTRDIITRACELTHEDQDTEMMWYFLEKLPNLNSTQLPEDGGPLSIRVTLDYEEDYWLLCSLQRMAGSFASRKEIDDIFLRNPDLYKINWFRNKSWKEGQLAKKI